jgi:hypothetical protein
MTALQSGILTYDDLVQRCQDWLFGRTDLAVQVPTFIQLFEAKANRKLLCRQMEQRCVTSIDLTAPEPEFISLPKDYQTMRRIRLINTQGTPPFKPSLDFASGQQLDALREKLSSPGQPIWYTTLANEIELLPEPNMVASVEMIYRAYLTPLSSDQQSNWLLALACDAYLYGTLMEAAPYLHDDDRISVWATGVQAAISDLNELSEKALYPTPMIMRRRASGYS